MAAAKPYGLRQEKPVKYDGGIRKHDEYAEKEIGKGGNKITADKKGKK